MDLQGHCLGQCLALSMAVASSSPMLISYLVDAFQPANSLHWRTTLVRTQPCDRAQGWESWKT